MGHHTAVESFVFFFFNDTATTEIYTLSLHDALPIFSSGSKYFSSPTASGLASVRLWALRSKSVRLAIPSSSLQPMGKRYSRDRKSTRLNSSHANISYDVFCLKKKKTINAVSSIQSYT